MGLLPPSFAFSATLFTTYLGGLRSIIKTKQKPQKSETDRFYMSYLHLSLEFCRIHILILNVETKLMKKERGKRGEFIVVG